MYKKIISIILLITFLFSCWKVEEENKETKKSNFFVKTHLWSDFLWRTTLKKIGKVTSSQDITLTANANGRVASIYVKSGDKVKAWQIIAKLEDNIWNYEISVNRALNGIERSKINYESTKINLDKQVYDAEANLEKLKRNLGALRKNSEQNILQVEDNLKNSKYANFDSKSALQLESLDNVIEKSKLDYDIKILADSETVEGYKSTLKKEYNSLLIFLDDIIEFSDEILWVTELNRDENNAFEDFLWAKDSSQKSVSEKKLLELINYRKSQVFLDTDIELQSGKITEEKMIEIIDFINTWYEKSKLILNSLETTLNNSVKSIGSLWDIEINTFIGKINGYQAQLQGNYGRFISLWTGIKSFLRTYKKSQSSLLKAIKLQEKDREIQFKTLTSWEINAETTYKKTVITLEDNIKNLESQVSTAYNNFENAKKLRDVTLRSLKNLINGSKINYASATKEYAKLIIRSPINGTISEVFIDKWQEVFSSVKLFDIVSDKTPEVEISFSKQEKELIKEGDKVFIHMWEEKITGKIYAISTVADKNLNYKAIIIFESGVNIIWNLVSVEIPIVTDKMLVPINIVTTKWDNRGTIKTLSGTTFNDVWIKLGEVFGEYIEVVSCDIKCKNLKIIMSDISNFDKNKFLIVEK